MIGDGGWLLLARELGIVVFWLVLVAVFGILSSAFLTADNMIGILDQTSIVAIFAVGEALVVMTGALDISIAPIAAIAGIVAASVLEAGGGPAVALIASLGVGLVAGLINGLIIDRLKVNPLIATLGTLSVFSGLALIITSGKPIFGVEGLEFLGQDEVAGVPMPVVVVAVLYLFAWFVTTQTRWGLRLLAVGGNAEAARRCGVRSRRYLIGAFVASGGCAALAGLVIFGTLNTAEPAVSNEAIFDAITAVALAGVLLSGGRGSVLKVFVGALIVATIANGLTLLNVPSYYTLLTTGILLIVAVASEQLLATVIERRRTAEGLAS